MTTPAYLILSSNSPLDLEERINRWLSDGYEPLGGVSVSMTRGNRTGENVIFAQAVIKRQDT